MKVKVKLFARFRELAGKAEADIQIDPGTSVAALKQQLSVLFPRLGEYVPSMMVAVNGELVGDDASVGEADEVALLPPISGG